MASIRDLIAANEYQYGTPQKNNNLAAFIIDKIRTERAKEEQRQLENRNRLEQEKQRNFEINKALAEKGLLNDFGVGDNQSEMSRVVNNNYGEQQKRGISKVDTPAMSTIDGYVGDVNGNRILERRQTTPIQERDPRQLMRRETSNPLQYLSDSVRQQQELESSQAYQKQKKEEEKQYFEVSDKLFDDLQKVKAYQDFNEISRAVGVIEAGYESSLTAKDRNAAHQALVVGFNKLLDPGSVVRESEFDRSAEGEKLINKFRARMNKLTEGGVISEEGAREIYEMSKELERKAAEWAKGKVQVILNRAERFGVDKNLIMPEGLFDFIDEGEQAGSAAESSVMSMEEPQYIGRFKIMEQM